MKKYKCRICGKKVACLRRGMCFDCNLMIAEEVEAHEHTCNEQEKINEGLFQLIQLQQDIIDELVKHIDNEAITQAIATRREICKRYYGAVARNAYHSWKEKL